MGALPKINHAERRRNKRYALVGGLPIELSRAGQTPLHVLVQDLSKDGLGIILSAPLRRAENLNLTWQGHDFEPATLRVVWVREVEDEDGTLYHCGLQTLDEAVDLEIMARNCDDVTLDELD